MRALKIECDVVDGWLQTIALEGELDAYTAPRLRDCLTQALDEGMSWILVDLRRADYIDSVGLGILIGGVKRAGESNGDLAVVCDRPRVRRVFEVSGTAELLHVTDELAHAVDLLATERAARAAGRCSPCGGHSECEGGQER